MVVDSPLGSRTEDGSMGRSTPRTCSTCFLEEEWAAAEVLEERRMASVTPRRFWPD